MMRSNLDRRGLEFKQFVPKFARNLKFCQAEARFLREMIRHFDVDVMRRNAFFARPTLLNDFNQFGRDIDAPPVCPARIKPIF